MAVKYSGSDSSCQDWWQKEGRGGVRIDSGSQDSEPGRGQLGRNEKTWCWKDLFALVEEKRKSRGFQALVRGEKAGDKLQFLSSQALWALPPSPTQPGQPVHSCVLASLGGRAVRSCPG